MRRFVMCAVLALAVAALLAPAFAAGKGAGKAARKSAAKTDDTQLIIKELYSVTPASAPSSEEFTATPVKLPPEMHVGVSGDPFAVDMGGVMLNPIPNQVGSH